MTMTTARRHEGVSPASAGDTPSPGRERRRRPAHRWRVWERIALGLLGIVIFGAITQCVTISFPDHDTLPVFTDVLLRFAQLFADPVFYRVLWETVSAFLLGIIIAVVIGVTIGIAFGLSDFAYRSSRTTLELIRPIPATSLIPVMILIFGTGLAPKIILVVLASVWSIIFNTLYGVRGVEPLAKDMARVFGRSRFDIIRSVVLPAALPMIWAGVKIASTVSLVVVITLELLLGGSVGIGGLISSAHAEQNDAPSAYAAIIVAGLLGLLVNIVLTAVERRYFAWSTTTREG